MGPYDEKYGRDGEGLYQDTKSGSEVSPETSLRRWGLSGTGGTNFVVRGD